MARLKEEDEFRPGSPLADQVWVRSLFPAMALVMPEVQVVQLEMAVV
jgi:hypothetical protein